MASKGDRGLYTRMRIDAPLFLKLRWDNLYGYEAEQITAAPSKNPCFSKIPQTSFPERMRNLPNSDFQLRDINLSVEALLDFFG
jgi:hypothetical protein